MNRASYPFIRQDEFRYLFISEGKNGIVTKAVDFTPLIYKNIFNLSFGDLLQNNKLDDKANTNNHDIGKVMTTLVNIIDDFTRHHKKATIMFNGSSIIRTMLYARILKRYYPIFFRTYSITATIKQDGEYEEKDFNPSIEENYSSFFIKRK